MPTERPAGHGGSVRVRPTPTVASASGPLPWDGNGNRAVRACWPSFRTGRGKGGVQAAVQRKGDHGPYTRAASDGPRRSNVGGRPWSPRPGYDDPEPLHTAGDRGPSSARQRRYGSRGPCRAGPGVAGRVTGLSIYHTYTLVLPQLLSGRDCPPVRKTPCFYGHGNFRRCGSHFAAGVPSADVMSPSTVNRGMGSGFQSNLGIQKANLRVSVRDTRSNKGQVWDIDRRPGCSGPTRTSGAGRIRKSPAGSGAPVGRGNRRTPARTPAWSLSTTARVTSGNRRAGLPCRGRPDAPSKSPRTAVGRHAAGAPRGPASGPRV